ncbi:MAG: signal peptidase I [Chloroflexota bacterium]
MEIPETPVTFSSETPQTNIVRPRHPAFDFFETILLAVVLFIGINYISARIRVDGSSMEPTLSDREFVLVNRLVYQIGEPARGDVVVFALPDNPDKEYIKRVIGVPGDRIVIGGREVTVNGDVLQEPYIADDPTYTGSWTVPEGSLFVLGDNRNNSTDSHVWGPVSQEHVVGKAILIYWPPEKWQVVH